MLYTVTNMEALVRSELNEPTEYLVTTVQILAALNDGYKEVGSRALCIEREKNVVTISGENLISVGDWKVKHVSVVSEDGFVGFADTDGVVFTDLTDVEWTNPVTGATLCKVGVPCVLPTMIGSSLLEENGYWPQGWFQWGKYMYVQPVPDDRYLLVLYIADNPDAALVNLTDLPSDLPEEFHECVVLFALYVLAFKLKRWGTAMAYYNRYTQLLMQKKADFISQYPDPLNAKEVPQRVRLEVL